MNSNNRISYFCSYASILFTVIMFVGCKEFSTSSTPPTIINNTAVVVTVTNAFTYAIDANAYTTNKIYDLSFSTDSLACTLTVGGYLSGNASINIGSTTNTVVYSDSIFSNKTIVILQSGKGIPKQCTLICNNFTGKISFVLSRIQSGK
mgnify:FL=1